MAGNQAAREQSEIRNARASEWMKRGIALLTENTSSSLTDSLRWFEKAIELRRTLPLQENPWYRYVLAAGWMNRGDALTRLGSTENLAEAVRSYDQALVLLRTLDLETNPLFRQRLALAWMNRGVALQAEGTAASVRAALESLDEAIALLRNPFGNGQAENRAALASALANRGNALLRIEPPSIVAARDSAEQALALIAGDEENDPLAAEIGLTARHVLCRAVAIQLADKTAKELPEDLVAAATDAVDDGLKLARRWNARGDQRFGDLAADLFRFGTHAYQRHQSHFLPEFLLENLDPSQSHDAFPPDPRMQAAASEAIASALAEIHRDGFRSWNTPHFDRFLANLRQLRSAQIRLDELRETAVCE